MEETINVLEKCIINCTDKYGDNRYEIQKALTTLKQLKSQCGLI